VLVDAVSSLGGIPVQFDEWNLDVCMASVQKGIALPPGITVAAMSDSDVPPVEKRARAASRMRSRVLTLDRSVGIHSPYWSVNAHSP